MAKTFTKDDVAAAVATATEKAAAKAAKAETKRILDLIKATVVDDKTGKTLIKTIVAAIKEAA